MSASPSVSSADHAASTEPSDEHANPRAGDPPATLAIAAELGQFTLETADQMGGIFVLWLALAQRFFRWDFDRPAVVRNLYAMANRSLTVVAFTSLFNGAILVVQAAPLVVRFGATEIIGWAAGFGVLNELAPLLVGLMFSGRVGANNTAELGTMVVTEQIDALRALAIDPLSYLILPRVIAMMIALVALNIIGTFIAMIGAVISAYLLLDIGFHGFVNSFLNLLDHWDFLRGFFKSIAFGAMIAMASSYYGLRTKGGAVGVGRAVNASVVAAAIGILGLDLIAAMLSR